MFVLQIFYKGKLKVETKKEMKPEESVMYHEV